MNAPVLRTEHRQQQALSPRLQQAVRLLQLSSLDFAQEVMDALGRNPFLEADESEDAPAAPDADGAPLAADALTSVTAPEATEAPDYGSSDSAMERDAERDSWQADGSSGNRKREDGELSLMDTMAVQHSLAEHLHGQLNLLPLSLRDMALAKAIVESLDDDGYLRVPLEELAQVCELDPEATLEEMQIALKRVQSLEPAGVAARSVQECLLLQLPAIECSHQRALAQAVISEKLDALAAKDVNSLSRFLSRPVEEVEAVCARIRRLDPRPGWRYGAANIQYLTPDVIVRKVRGQWVATLNPAIVPKVRLNRVYAELFQRHRNGMHAELAAHLQEARWTVRNVEQRFSTIVSVAQAIVNRQRHFLEYGAMAMKPLGLREIADEVGLHESTVSRVTNNKYMATPLGVFELKYFFSRAMATAGGGTCSATAIRGLIKDMIEAERAEAPLSDAEIARQLARQGLVVARRTVTKYRQTLRIEAVERRRKHA